LYTFDRLPLAKTAPEAVQRVGGESDHSSRRKDANRLLHNCLGRL
jgi:hypothetical protein